MKHAGEWVGGAEMLQQKVINNSQLCSRKDEEYGFMCTVAS
jgi:hypothetical protein